MVNAIHKMRKNHWTHLVNEEEFSLGEEMENENGNEKENEMYNAF